MLGTPLLAPLRHKHEYHSTTDGITHCARARTHRQVLRNIRCYADRRGPLSLSSTTEKLLERKSSSSGLENRDYGSRYPPR
jgi:hypothetical protein